GSRSEGFVPSSELQSLGPNFSTQLKPGDTVLVSVLGLDPSEGGIQLSIDRARGERGWRLLQEHFDSGETFEAVVVGQNKGGLLVNFEGVAGFIPLSQVVGARADQEGEGQQQPSAVGRKIRLKVIEFNRRRNRLILSERAALQEWRTQQKDKLLSELREGDIRKGKVTSIRDFGVFIDLGGADGLAHLSELSWERNKKPGELFKVGDEVDAYVLKVDLEAKKIALSIRRAGPDRWAGVVEQFQPGEIVVGRITKLMQFGAFARLDGGAEGLIHISEIADRRITHPRDVVQEGQVVPLRVVRIEPERHRLGLSLKQAIDQGERMGFVFAPDGRVREVPEIYQERFGLAPRPEPEAGVAADEEAPAAAAIIEAEAGDVLEAASEPESGVAARDDSHGAGKSVEAAADGILEAVAEPTEAPEPAEA
ncbi:MAG: S1 RNA-binding domain-containing protein, partial [Thermomicrobiales bacterium]|nr:S1 RNA-binding domain-containing protein [Thermomicrobiales bacterium]